MVLFQKCVRPFGPSTKMGPTAELSFTQDPMGNSHKNLLIWNQLLNWNQTLITQSLDGPLPKLCLVVPPSDQDGCITELSLTQDPMGNSHKNHLIWNQQVNQNQTLMEQSLDGPLPKFCLTVVFSHQDGHHSAVALLLKAAFIQVSDYRLLGASGSKTFSLDSTYIVLPNPSTVYLYCVTKSFHSLSILCYQILPQFTMLSWP